MAVQKFADWGTSFDTDNIEGQLCWSEFCDRLKAGEKGRVVRLRFLGDRMMGWIIYDLSYCYVELGGKIYDVRNFPLHNGQTKSIKKDLYKYICQDKDTPFIPDMFTNLSIFI